jgi:cytochrome c554/c'-like protein
MIRISAGVRGAAGLLVLVAAGAIARADSPGPLQGMPGAEREFLARHWRRPVKPQGPAPAAFSPLERSLAPESCGTCHPAQLADWKTTLHSKSMGYGVAGQLVEMRRTDPDAGRSCLTCHAPLAEQSEEIEGPRGAVSNPDFDAGLQRQGLFCAACHVRQHQRFGPPRRVASPARPIPRASLPHNGATRSAAYLRSEFCSSCHQFQPTDLRLNGKLLQDTYAEWRASPAARQGLQCQDCHMPDRRHLWRGIHDPDMVKSGVDISFAPDRPRHRPGEDVRATLTIRSVRVGHYFPTYVTPRVVVRGELLDATGAPVPGSAKERAIGRDVPLDLSREIADTRIPPDGRFAFEYRHHLTRPGLSLRVTVTVFPDHFYTRFFESLLAGGAGLGTAQIGEALEASRRSPFVIFSRDIPLT